MHVVSTSCHFNYSLLFYLTNYLFILLHIVLLMLAHPPTLVFRVWWARKGKWGKWARNDLQQKMYTYPTVKNGG